MEEHNSIVLEFPNNPREKDSIYWGTKKINFITQKSDVNTTMIKFSDGIYSLNGTENVNIYRDISGNLRIGPFLGLFVSNKKKRRILQGNKDTVYYQIADHMKVMGGHMVLFSFDNINWDNLVVNGHTLITDSENYTPVCVPLPRVIYDRSFNSEEGFQLREHLVGNPEVKIFNSLVKLGKLETFNLLFQDPELKKIISPYCEFNYENLKRLMEQYNSIYIKPDISYKDEGIIRVSKVKAGYRFERYFQKTFANIVTNNLKHTTKLMEDFGESSTSYVLQKNINSAFFLGNPFEVKVLLQKNSTGDWEVTSALACVGPEDSMLSNPGSGGKVLNLPTTLQNVFPEDSEKVKHILNKIDQYSKKIGQVLESKYGLLGELGIDLEVDQEGDIWLLEVNGKPLKSSMKKLKNNNVNININRYPCLFGAYLDGFFENNEKGIERAQDTEAFFELTEVLSLPRQTICLAKEQIEDLGLYPDKPVALKIGVKVFFVQLHHTTVPFKLNQIGISTDILSEIGLSPGIKLNLITSQNNVLWLGPLFAMMISPIGLDMIKKGQIIKELKYSEEVAHELGCLMFFFTAHDINWTEQKMQGCYLNRKSGVWEENWLPLPDVVNDQATFSPRKDLLEKAKEMLKEFKNRNDMIVINNRRYFGKNEAISAMTFFKHARPLAPETREMNGPDDLVSLINKWKRVFVKVEFGSYGMGVIRVDKTDKGYQCETGESGHEKNTFTNIESVYNYLSDKTNQSTAVVQQGIKLSSYCGRKFDLRIIVTKVNQTDWKIKLVAVRLAAPGNTITNISSGGLEFTPPLDKIENYIPHLKLEKLMDFSEKCALAIETYYSPQGVLGIDAGVDSTGRLWLLEINSKPSILDYLDLCDAEYAYNLYTAPTKYGIYLVKQTTDVVCDQLKAQLQNL